MGFEPSSIGGLSAKMTLVPPLISPRRVPRTRMAETPFKTHFGHVDLRSLFTEFISGPRQFRLNALLAPDVGDGGQETDVELGGWAQATAGAEGGEGGIVLRAHQPSNPDTFLECITSSDRLGSVDIKAAYFENGIGVFGHAHGHKENWYTSALAGLRMSSTTSSVGLTAQLAGGTHIVGGWLLGKFGNVTTGVEASTSALRTDGTRDWDCKAAISFNSVSGDDPQRPGFVFALEGQRKAAELSFLVHRHIVFQRMVTNPLEDENVTSITNYVDVGFRMVHSLRDPKSPPTTELGAAWQLNKNWLFKSTVQGLHTLCLCSVFKMWSCPSVTLGCTMTLSQAQQPEIGVSVTVDDVSDVEFERVSHTYPGRRPATRREAAVQQVVATPTQRRQSSAYL
eukprot:m.179753 g.179753  ORF g.179753 m.179753 type:complete len:397 (-) comp18000_c0_seq2:125-1315(-)